MVALRLRAPLGAALLAALVLAAPAVAAPPAAVDDALPFAFPTGTLDVLGNDSDPDGDDLAVTGTSDPAHGTVECSPLGACLYEADDGYTGPDEFTYTLTAGGESDTATVSVTVTAPVVGSTILARDDDAATLAGRAVDIDILANDSGQAPLSLVSHEQPAHGSATCTDAGCRYTPADGFTGADGFTYKMKDGGGQERSAAVHVLVAPAGTTYGLTGDAMADGGGGIVAPGGLARWFLGASVAPEGISGEELGALPPPELSLGELSGPHALDAVTAAKGWQLTGSTAKAGGGALLGEAVNTAFPKPLPPLSQGTGGDGHVPFVVGSEVLAVYHHQDNTRITCVDRLTGELCPGYPMQTGMSSSDSNGPAAVSGTKLWTHLFPRGPYNGNAYTQSAPIALWCWDTATDSTCGLTVFDRQDRSSQPGASHPVMADGKVWMVADTGLLYCLDPQTGEECEPITTNLDPIENGDFYDAITHGTRVFVARRGGEATCIDVRARAVCPGWETPKPTPPDSGANFRHYVNLVNQYDASGSVVGACLVYNGNGTCYPDADPSSPTTFSGWPSHIYDYYNFTLEGETGTRTFVGSLATAGMACWDWTTLKVCEGPNFGPDGRSTKDVDGVPLPDAYGVAWDGSCNIGIGDQGRVFTMDVEGNSPCSSLSSGAEQRSIDLRDQRCDGTVGAAAWREVVLSDTNAAEMESVTVTVRDAGTGAVLATKNLLDGALDLSGVDPRQHPAITVDATLKTRSGEGETEADPWGDGIPPRIVLRWKSDPKQLCAATRGTAECSSAGQSPLGLTGRLAAPADARQLGLVLARPACAGPSAPAVAQSLPTRKRVCSGRRQFNIRVRYLGRKVDSIRVTVNGKRQKVLRRTPRPVVRIDLRKLSKQRTVVRIRIRTRSGKVLRGTRVYNPCTKKLRGSGKIRL